MEPANPSPRPRPPTTLYALALLGLILGGVGVVGSISQGLALMQTHDEYARPNSWFKENLREPVAELLIAQREAHYRRRGALLPVQAMGLILSWLLFLGCRRALRGHEWGASAWSLAALAGIPQQLLAGAVAVVVIRDLRRTLAGANPDAVHQLSGAEATILVLAMLQIAYFAACALYLRRESVRRFFTDGAGTPTSA